MKLIGLTGGVGMGKSTVAEFLGKRGMPVIDTDQVAREIVEPGQPALQEIEREFGNEVIGPDGYLRRKHLAQIVFSDAESRKRLETITHPRIRQYWQEQALQWREHNVALAFVMIPLLFEVGEDKEFESVVCVACSSGIQKQRLLARSWTEVQIEQRRRAQWPIEQKMAAARYVIWNDAGVDLLERQLARVLSRIEGN